MQAKMLHKKECAGMDTTIKLKATLEFKRKDIIGKLLVGASCEDGIKLVQEIDAEFSSWLFTTELIKMVLRDYAPPLFDENGEWEGCDEVADLIATLHKAIYGWGGNAS